MNVEIVVDELVLHGVRDGDARAVMVALESALEGVVSTWAGSGAALASRDEASRRVAIEEPTAAPPALGQQVATAVWTAVTGGRT